MSSNFEEPRARIQEGAIPSDPAKRVHLALVYGSFALIAAIIFGSQHIHPF